MKEFFGKLKRKLNSLGRRKLLAIVLMTSIGVTAIFGAGIGITYASYKRRLASDSAVSVKEFYFTSGLLTAGGATYDIYSSSISFDLMNYSDELKTSKQDIEYNVTLTSSDGGEIPAGVNTSGTLKCKTNTEDEVFTPTKATVTYSGLTLGKTYTVTAKATAPYTKTLSATFNIIDGDYQIPYTVENKEDYVLFTIFTTDYIGNVNITWQNGYVPDNSVPILATATGTSHTATLTHKSVYSLKFYKADTDAVFDETAFTLSVAE